MGGAVPTAKIGVPISGALAFETGRNVGRSTTQCRQFVGRGGIIGRLFFDVLQTMDGGDLEGGEPEAVHAVQCEAVPDSEYLQNAPARILMQSCLVFPLAVVTYIMTFVCIIIASPFVGMFIV